MRRPSSYNTKQGEAILSYIASLQGSHVTVEQIDKHFKNQKMSVGVTTIYRNLDKLLISGKIRKYMIDGIYGACYQYVEKPSVGGEHYHLKCQVCGGLCHFQCGTIKELSNHVANEHAFEINIDKTVFYGICGDCKNKI